MIFNTATTYRIPRQLEEVPNTSTGVYAFCLRFPTDFEFGIGGYSKVENVIENVVRKLELFEFVANSIGVKGTLADESKALHLQNKFTVAASSHHAYTSEFIRKIFFQFISSNDVEALSEVLKAIRISYEFSSPLYVGMTTRQSFRQRLEQHYSGGSQFASRAANLGLDWNDMQYRCIPISDISIEKTLEIEKLIHALFKPKLSER